MGILGCQEDGQWRDIFRLTKTAQRRTCDQFLAKLPIEIAFGQRRVGVTWQYGVDSDAFPPSSRARAKVNVSTAPLVAE